MLPVCLRPASQLVRSLGRKANCVDWVLTATSPQYPRYDNSCKTRRNRTTGVCQTWLRAGAANGAIRSPRWQRAAIAGREIEYLGGLEIDHQLECIRQLGRRIG